MNCGIATVYNSQNCGSYLQAYALTEYLCQNGKHAACIKHTFFYDGWILSRSIAINMLRGRVTSVLRLIHQNRAFKRAYSRLKFVKKTVSMDCVVLGSDTIWDVSAHYFNKHHNFFWGTAFPGKRIISYAPSIGYAKKEHLEACPWIASALKNMKKVSVRDTDALELLQPLCDKSIFLVCDPTFLLDKEQYMQIATQVKEDNYIFLYYYGHMLEEDAKQLKELAARENLKIITFGSCNPWCGNNEPYDPLRFLGLYDKAKYVVTNTFHGVAFAHIFRKKFAVIHSEKPKVINLLARMGTSDKSTYGNRKVADILSSDFDYEMIEKKIEQEREISMSYLKDALTEE